MELSALSMNLVENASLDELKDLFADIFGVNRMRSMLKQKIEYELNNLPPLHPNRIILMSKINKFRGPNQSRYSSNATSRPRNLSYPQTFTAIKTESNNKGRPRVISEINTKIPYNPISISWNEWKSIKPIDAENIRDNPKLNDLFAVGMPNSSTYKLLFEGFLKQNLPNHHRFSSDIMTLCHSFLGGIIHLTQLKILTHWEESGAFGHSWNKKIFNTLDSVFDDDDTDEEITKVKQGRIFRNYTQTNLLTPYNILVNDDDATIHSFGLEFIPEPELEELKVADVSVSSHTVTAEYSQSNPRETQNKGIVQYLDKKRSRLLNFGGIFPRAASEITHIGHHEGELTDTRRIMGCDLNVVSNPEIRFFPSWKQSVSWQSYGQMEYSRCCMSICGDDEDYAAIIGGALYCNPRNYHSSYARLQAVNHVELFNLETRKTQILKGMNHARMECGSVWNKYSNEIIVFGGREGSSMMNLNGASTRMEIYDIHKNVWYDINNKTSADYPKYPCIGTIGSKCIFVAGLQFIHASFGGSGAAIKLKCEWIDLRETDQNGRRVAQFKEYSVDSERIVEKKQGMQFTLFSNL